jgi:hypothetical protein
MTVCLVSLHRETRKHLFNEKIRPHLESRYWQQGCCNSGADFEVDNIERKKIMPMMRKVRQAFRCSNQLRATVAVVLVLFVVLAAFAASPSLHQAIHSDATSPNHHCAITLLAHGQIEMPECGSTLCLAPISYAYAPLVELSVSSGIIELLPPGRGPPALFS